MKTRAFTNHCALAGAAALLNGCGSATHAPTVDIIGSYFPAWIVCIVLGLVLALVLRLLLIGLKIDAYLRLKLIVYLCAAVCFALAIWLMLFKN